MSSNPKALVQELVIAHPEIQDRLGSGDIHRWLLPHVAMYLLYVALPFSMEDIAAMFEKSSSSVECACASVYHLRKADPAFKALLDVLEDQAAQIESEMAAVPMSARVPVTARKSPPTPCGIRV